MASSAERVHEARGPADPEKLLFADDGVFPNSRLPVLIYRGVLATPDAAAFERMFEANGWSSSWRNGLYAVHHYHSTGCSASTAAASMRASAASVAGP